MSNPREQQDTSAPGHYGNQRPQQEGDRPSGQDRQEQYQRTREQAPSDPGRHSEESDSGQGEISGAAIERDQRIRQRAYRLWEEAGRPEGQAHDHWERAAQDLDREDADILREGSAGPKPGVKSSAEPDRKTPPPDRT